jgi:hypothetical protein
MQRSVAAWRPLRMTRVLVWLKAEC